MWLRETPFNFKRAELCNRECSKNMDSIESKQHQAKALLVKEYREKCLQKNNAKERQSCLDELCKLHVEQINGILKSLTQ